MLLLLNFQHDTDLSLTWKVPLLQELLPKGLARASSRHNLLSNVQKKETCLPCYLPIERKQKNRKHVNGC